MRRAAAGHESGDALILDVREDDEWRAGHIPGATHVPLGELAERVAELPARQPIFVVCRSGKRGLDGTTLLRAAGFDALNVAGGMQAWQEAAPAARAAGRTGDLSPMLVAVPFGLAIGLSLGLVGAGGSILAVPVLVYVLDQPVKSATTASLLIVGASALVAGMARVGQGCICWRLAIAFGLTGAVGTVAGTELNSRASGEAILVLFAVVMLAAAYAMVRQGAGDDGSTDLPPLRWSRVLPVGIALGRDDRVLRDRRRLPRRAGARAGARCAAASVLQARRCS